MGMSPPSKPIVMNERLCEEENNEHHHRRGGSCFGRTNQSTNSSSVSPSMPLISSPIQKNRKKEALLRNRHNIHQQQQQTTSLLLHFIAQRDWEKVLQRASLYPFEIWKEEQLLLFGGIDFTLLPIHLACAVQSPPKVVEMLLSMKGDTTTTTTASSVMKRPLVVKQKKHLQQEPTMNQSTRKKSQRKSRRKPSQGNTPYVKPKKQEFQEMLPSQKQPSKQKSGQRRNERLMKETLDHQLLNKYDGIHRQAANVTRALSLESNLLLSPATEETQHDIQLTKPKKKKRQLRRSKSFNSLSRPDGHAFGLSSAAGKQLGGGTFKSQHINDRTGAKKQQSKSDDFLLSNNDRGGRLYETSSTTIPSPLDDSFENNYIIDHDEKTILFPGAFDTADETSSLNQFLDKNGMYLQLDATTNVGGLFVEKISDGDDDDDDDVQQTTAMPQRLHLSLSQPIQHDQHYHSTQNRRNNNNNNNVPSFTSDMVGILVDTNEILPLHIACLFQVSPSVLELLLNAYPEGARVSNTSFGLPIHIVCAGIHLSSPFVSLSSSRRPLQQQQQQQQQTSIFSKRLSSSKDEESSKSKEYLSDGPWDIVTVIQLLLGAYPESGLIPHDGLTPLQHLENMKEEIGHETMQCLRLLLHLEPPPIDDIRSTDSVASFDAPSDECDSTTDIPYSKRFS